MILAGSLSFSPPPDRRRLLLLFRFLLLRVVLGLLLGLQGEVPEALRLRLGEIPLVGGHRLLADGLLAHVREHLRPPLGRREALEQLLALLQVLEFLQELRALFLVLVLLAVFLLGLLAILGLHPIALG